MNSLETLFSSLEEQSWAWSDTMLPKELTMELFRECEALWQQNKFHAAHIGSDTGKTSGTTSGKMLRPEIRGDSISWLHSENPMSQKFLIWAESLRYELNRRYFLGLNSEELHFARYPSGAGYHKHLDQHKSGGPRKISMVLYLNPQWSTEDGGELLVYSPEEPHIIAERILPSFGRLVLFRSDSIPHEVLPCFQTRWSLTGWFRAEVQLPA